MVWMLFLVSYLQLVGGIVVGKREKALITYDKYILLSLFFLFLYSSFISWKQNLSNEKDFEFSFSTGFKSYTQGLHF